MAVYPFPVTSLTARALWNPAARGGAGAVYYSIDLGGVGGDGRFRQPWYTVGDSPTQDLWKKYLWLETGLAVPGGLWPDGSWPIEVAIGTLLNDLWFAFFKARWRHPHVVAMWNTRLLPLARTLNARYIAQGIANSDTVFVNDRAFEFESTADVLQAAFEVVIANG